MYRIKQASLTWYSRIENYLRSFDFSKIEANANLYFKVVKNQSLILILYVDDLFLTVEEQMIAQCKRDLTSEFEMKDSDLMRYFLVLEVWKKKH